MFAYQPEPPRLAGGRVPLSPLSTEPTADTELINTGEMENAHSRAYSRPTTTTTTTTTLGTGLVALNVKAILDTTTCVTMCLLYSTLGLEKIPSEN